MKRRGFLAATLGMIPAVVMGKKIEQVELTPLKIGAQYPVVPTELIDDTCGGFSVPVEFAEIVEKYLRQGIMSCNEIRAIERDHHRTH